MLTSSFGTSMKAVCTEGRVLRSDTKGRKVIVSSDDDGSTSDMDSKPVDERFRVGFSPLYILHK